jgi:RNA polymerase sigma-70 factor (ECF subfamily)
LYGIASNLLRRHWRTEQRRLRANLRHASSYPVPGDPLVAVDARVDAQRRLVQVIAAVEDLEPEDRDLLVLIVWEHCTSREAAQALGIPAGTVRSRLSRIRTQLRNERGAPQ